MVRGILTLHKKIVARRKKKKLAELILLPNVLEKPAGMAGHWYPKFFKRDLPVTLEIGCGRGEYTYALAQQNPDKNFLGIDTKGDRLWKGALQAYESGLHNAGFLRIRVENILDYFEQGEISEIWITFPDPFPKASKENQRLVAPFFLDKYRKLLNKSGIIHLKTDNTGLFEFAMETFTEQNCQILHYSDDLHGQKNGKVPSEAYLTKTKYEEKFMGESTIKYVACCLD